MEKKKNFALIMILYLFGLFIGALSTGIITPARTIIQNSLGVGEQTGIWMITIYTLCYAAIIPVSGKMADRMGRKLIYLISIALFGVGSVICGLSAGMDSFAVLIAGRVVQAIGAGGIMPIATAEFGTSFPEEKRGMALGLVGAVYGIANVLGATAGSAILDIFGTANWQWIFYINVPFCVLIIVGSLFYVPNSRSEVAGRIDKLGTLLMTLIILSLLYGLKNIDFFNFLPSLIETDVYPFLITAIVLLPLFVWAEKRAEDPIFNLAYVQNKQIIITLVISLFVGASMMGMIFIPQFAENALRIPTGSGGYFVIILGLCAGLASPISGTLIDKMGAKPVLAAGLIISVLGCLYLSFITIHHMTMFHVIMCLVLIGLGLGLTMGTPLNYMMLQHTSDEESNSALATLSLIRSIGTAIAPAIMVGFIAQAGMCMSDNLMGSMPEIPSMPAIEQQAELNDIFAELKELNKDNPEMLEMLSMADKMDMSSMNMNMDMTGGDMELPDELLAGMQSADVTTIVDESKNMAKYMFEANTPAVIEKIQNGIGEGIDGISEGIDGMDKGIAEMQSGIDGMDAGKAELQQGIDGISQGIAGMEAGLAKQDEAIAAMEKMMCGDMKGKMPEGMADMTGAMPDMAGAMPEGMPEGVDAASGATPAAKDNTESKMPEGMGDMSKGGDMQAQLKELKSARAELKGKLETSKAQRTQMQSALAEMTSAQDEMKAGIESIEYQQSLMKRAKTLMQEMRDEIPALFEQTMDKYLDTIEAEGDELQTVYQDTLNEGFKGMYITVAAFNAAALLFLAFYKDGKKKTA